jgi:SprT-like family protein
MILSPDHRICFVLIRSMAFKLYPKSFILYPNRMRDQAWLQELFDSLYQKYFSDVEQNVPIEVKFGKRARNRLGSLSYDHHKNQAVLRVTRLFQDKAIPEYVVKATIIHELCHYAHGFHSGLDRKYDYPHRNGVIRKEFAERGLEQLYLRQKQWLKANWLSVVKKHYPHKIRRRRKIVLKII